MTSDDLQLARDLGVATKHAIEAATAPLVQRIADLEARVRSDGDRIKVLEQRPFPEHRGVWDANESYKELEMVSHHGSGWICKAPCHGVAPGSDPRWKLLSKKAETAKTHTDE